MKKRLKIDVNGIVQGVGFRPFVFNLAQSLSLSGFVTNSSNGVEIELQGGQEQLTLFMARLQSEAPPLSEINTVRSEEIALKNSTSFIIAPSPAGSDNQTLISPDMSICDDCYKELFDPANRRFLYPFINCTNCGPRYTIINSIPYDRPFTSMSGFKMCPSCQDEYDDPTDRRFHAQPNACTQCGPHIWCEDSQQRIISKKNEAFSTAAEQLLEGKIIAIKGLGGFHLAVDASNDKAVKTLRQRKNREEKPLALMVQSLEMATKIVHSSPAEERLLKSPQRPIILLQQRGTNEIAHSVAPGNKRLGIMLPYTPLHYILYYHLKQRAPDGTALVMTSANLSDEPIAITNEDARKRLATIADSFLMHNRDILIRADDSVLMDVEKSPFFFRRSRGYAPKPVFLKGDGPSLLAVGAELKNTICFTKNDRAFLSQHIGDLENYEANRSFEESINHLQTVLEVNPEAVICDMHPGYFSTQWALQQQNYPPIKVQHHHAHLASVMAEKKIEKPVIGIILDGSGYGYDKTIWGGEILIGNFTEIRRFAHLQHLPLPGGEAAIKEPWRIAYAWLYSLFGKDFPALPFMENRPLKIIRQMVDKKLNTPLTSSCGRLFDAVAAMSGGRETIKYEGQAAIEMMQAVEDTSAVQPYEYNPSFPVITIKPIVQGILNDLIKGQNFSKIAGRFHRTMIALFTSLAKSAREHSGIDEIVLSGGVMQNELLISGLLYELNQNSFRVFCNRQVPVNDAGIALGQAAIGRQLIKEDKTEIAYSENQ